MGAGANVLVKVKTLSAAEREPLYLSCFTSEHELVAVDPHREPWDRAKLGGAVARHPGYAEHDLDDGHCGLALLVDTRERGGFSNVRASAVALLALFGVCRALRGGHKTEPLMAPKPGGTEPIGATRVEVGLAEAP
jgi:hypothetical protein